MKKKKIRMGLLAGWVIIGCLVPMTTVRAGKPDALKVISEGVKASSVITEDTVLSADAVYNDSLTIQSRVDLNGHVLRVNGDLTIAENIKLNKGVLVVTGNVLHTDGSVEFGRGSIEVSGDYRIQDVKESSGGGREYIGSDGYLYMDEADDLLKVGGSLIIQSNNGNSLLRDGTIEIAGDMIQKNGNAYNFNCYKNHKVILTGNALHKIEMESEESGFASLDAGNGKLIWNGYMRIWKMLSDASAEPDTGKELILNGIYLNGKELDIQSDIKIASEVDLNGGTLKVTGNVLHTNGEVKFNQGNMEISGDYRIQDMKASSGGDREYIGSNGYLCMNETDDLLKVGGNFITQSNYVSNYLTSGTMEIGGNIIQKNGYARNFNCYDNKVILTGTAPHKIEIESEESGFASLDAGSGKLVWNGYMRIGKLLKDTSVEPDAGKELMLNGIDLNGKKLTLQSDVRIMSTVNLNGGAMKVTGNVLHTNGEVNFNQGSLEISGDYRIQDVKVSSGGGKEYMGSNGYLYMREEDDLLRVGGDFVTQSNSDINYLYDGTMEIAGNVIQKNGYPYNFSCYHNHRVILTGTKPQRVEMESANCGFYYLKLTRPLSNYTFIPNPCWEVLEGIKIPVADCTVENISDQTYTGGEIRPGIRISIHGLALTEGTDYTLSYSGNINKGTASAVITGKGNYSGTKTITFRIQAKSIGSVSIGKIADKAYTGKAIKPVPVLENGGTRLKTGIDYTLKYSNNKKTGKASVTITGQGNYTGTVKKSFQIVPKKTANVKGKTSGKKAVQLSWKKDAMASGYVIQYSTDKKFKKNVKTVTIKKYSTSSKKISKLTSKKTYYFRVRSYKTINGKKAYGSYSKTVKVRVN